MADCFKINCVILMEMELMERRADGSMSLSDTQQAGFLLDGDPKPGHIFSHQHQRSYRTSRTKMSSDNQNQ